MGIFKKFGFGLRKTREGMTKNIEEILGAYEEITDDLYDELEEALIMGDVGMQTATDIVEALRERVDKGDVRNPKHAKMIIFFDIEKENLLYSQKMHVLWLF